MSALSRTLVLLVGLINLLRFTGVSSVHRLEFLYGVVLQDPNIVLLMRHRAILFGIVGGLLVVSAFHPPLRAAGYAAGLISMVSFVLLAWIVGTYNSELRRVVVIDVVASAAPFAALPFDRLKDPRRIAT